MGWRGLYPRRSGAPKSSAATTGDASDLAPLHAGRERERGRDRRRPGPRPCSSRPSTTPWAQGCARDGRLDVIAPYTGPRERRVTAARAIATIVERATSGASSSHRRPWPGRARVVSDSIDRPPPGQVGLGEVCGRWGGLPKSRRWVAEDFCSRRRPPAWASLRPHGCDLFPFGLPGTTWQRGGSLDPGPSVGGSLDRIPS